MIYIFSTFGDDSQRTQTALSHSRLNTVFREAKTEFRVE